MFPNVYIYIAVMAIVTYLIRMLPLVLLRKEIENSFIKSFLYYVPYVTLSVMIFPAIFTSTGHLASAICGFVVATLLAWFQKNLFVVALSACAAVFIVELTIKLL